MIRCDQCGTDNRLGAIFCKSCGQRLNLDNAESQIQSAKRKERFSPKRFLSAGRKLLSFLLLIVFVLVLAGIFLGVPVQYTEPVSEETFDNARSKLEKFADKQFRKRNDPTITFSSAEATALVNRWTNLRQPEDDSRADEDPGLALQPQMISVDFLPSGYVRVVLTSTTFKGIKIYSSVIGRFESSKEKVEFIIQSSKIGKVPMPGPLRDIVISRFRALGIDQKVIEKMRSAIDYIEVSNDQATMHLNQVKN